MKGKINDDIPLIDHRFKPFRDGNPRPAPPADLTRITTNCHAAGSLEGSGVMQSGMLIYHGPNPLPHTTGSPGHNNIDHFLFLFF
jgi:hypothetical protein